MKPSTITAEMYRAVGALLLALTVGMLTAPSAAALTISGEAWEDTNNDGQRNPDEPAEDETVTAYLCEPPWGIVGVVETSDDDGRFSFELEPAWYQFGVETDDELTHLFVGDPASDNDFWTNGFTSCYDYREPQPPLGLGFVAEEEGEVEVADIFFELNDTDGDLGLQGLIDTDGWVELEFAGPGDDTLIELEVAGALAEQGMTEFFFESSEPSFDELAPSDFFARFPEGEYEVELEGQEGESYEATVELSHVMPAPVGNVRVAGVPAADDCDADLPVVASDESVMISWDASLGSHPELGEAGSVDVDNYQFVIEIEDEEADRTHEMNVTLPPSFTSYVVPAELIALAPEGEVKFEIGVQAADTLNRTVTESCFLAQ